MTYKIFEGNLERLEKKLTRIANKCKNMVVIFVMNRLEKSLKM